MLASLILALGASAGVAAATPLPVAPPQLTIRLMPAKMKKAQVKEAMLLCEALAKNLVVEKGPDGAGAFSDVKCVKGPARKDDSATEWQLTMTPKKKTLAFILKFETAAKPPQPVCREAVAEVALPLAALPGASYRDELVADLATFFLDAMPMFARGAALARLKAPRSEWTSYGLGFDSATCLWIPSGVTSGDSLPAPGTWVHARAGRGTKMAALKAKIAKTKPERRSPVKSFLDSFLGGQKATARLGLPMIRDNPLLTKTYMIGLGLSLNRGTLDGLTANIDIVPQVKAELDGVDSKFSWQRWSFGWAFRFEPGFLNSLAVIPRLGAWTLEAELPQETPAGETVAESYSFKRAFAVGLEVQAERSLGSIYTAPHCAVFVARALPKANQQVTVGSNRCGIDLSFYQLRFGHFFPHGFVDYDYIYLVSQRDGSGAEDLEIEEQTITFSQIYAGGGFTLEW